MARTAMFTWAALSFAAACGPKMEPTQPQAGSAPAATSEPATAEPAPEPAPDEPAAASAEPSAGMATESPQPSPALRAQCEEVCQQVAAKCSKTVAENCAINCEKYDKTPSACESYARAALSCAAAAKDLPCANVAPESCARQYRTLTECQRAPDTFQVKSEETKQKLPEGWGVYDEGTFSVPVPGGMSKSSVDKETVWTATTGKVRYSVRKLPPLAEKLTPKNQVRLATEWLKPCTLKMKLHGHVEKGDRSSLHYDVGCKDGTERHGMVHITPSALYIVGTEAPAGEKAQIETFVYGFALK